MHDISIPVLPAQPAAPDDARSRRIARDLGRIVTGEVRFDHHYRMLYATDASIYQVEPLGVVIPRTVDEAAEVVRYCAINQLPLLPRGGGTSLAGQTVNTAVVLDFSRHCTRVIDVDVAGRTALIEPGIILEQLNAAMLPHGLMFGPDVATSGHANVGGMIGNNSAGAYSIRYGRTVEHLLAIEAALADGSVHVFEEGAALRDERLRELTEKVAEIILPLAPEIRRRFPKTRRRVDGYNLDLILEQIERSTPGTFDRVNLAHLLCGSEGTLAVTLRAKVRLVETPRKRGLVIVSFNEVREALEAVNPILRTQPAAVELLDDVVIDLARENLEYRRYVDLMPQPPLGTLGAVLYVEYFANDDAELASKFAELDAVMHGQAMKTFSDAPSMQFAWKLRKAGEPLLHAIPGHRKPVTFIEDTAVDPTRLPEFVAEFRQIVARHNTRAACYAHASVGCLHIRPLIAIHDPADRAVMQSIAEEVTDLVIRFGGALSGEHGDGRVRSPLLERFFGPQIMTALRQVKAVFDPENRLNPGNIVDPLPMTAHLRVEPHEAPVVIPKVDTFYRYQREHGFGEAVEMCNGAGVCRRRTGGTMCPSYRATLDERHATRGRGNALRLAISGQFSPDGSTPSWDDPDTIETLDLCLSCKACKSECPSNVDVAKLKAEYTGQRYAAGVKPPLNIRMFGRVRTLNRLGSAFHPIANFLARFPLTRAVAGAVLGLHSKRSLPPVGKSLYAWFSAHHSAVAVDAPAVVLFPDCFTVYNEPHIGRAAVLALEAFGYRVILPKLGCCGRSMISNGLLEDALRTCRDTAVDLLRVVHESKAIAVVGCEPSCVSAIKDDWLDLKLNLPDSELQSLALRTFLVEEFIDREWESHPRRPTIRNPQRGSTVLLHGHCHQKALWGVDTSARALRRICGEQLRVVDAGCCGMAGAFGFTKDHYELSMQVGELVLLPAVRSEPDAVIAAPGTSCRHQIHDGAQRHAMHPVELIAQAIR